MTLTYIDIPSGVTSIGESAFSDCDALTSITIPSKVTFIGDLAFTNCSSLKSIHISDLKAWCEIVFDGGMALYDWHLYLNGEEVKKLIIPNSVASIGSFAFSGCCGLTSVIIPNGVTLTSIGSGAFYGCSGLTSVHIPNSVTSIGGSAFQNCSSLTSVISEIENPFAINNTVFNGIPSNARLAVLEGKKTAYQSTAGWNQFSNIDQIAAFICSIEVDGICYEIGENNTVSAHRSSTQYSGDLVIPDKVEYLGTTYNVTSIGYHAFYGCSGLTSVIIPNSVKSIYSAAFKNCTSLTSVTISNNVNYMDDDVFWGCSSLTSVTIPSSLTSTGGCTFVDCSSLTSITIPNGMESIGWSDFQGCIGLTSVLIPNSVTSISGLAFSGCSALASLTIPSSVTSIGEKAFNGTAWYNNQPDGLVYAGKVAYDYKGQMPANTQISIQEGTLGISPRAFSNCSGLTSVTIPNSVTSIGYYAFADCSGLTSIISEIDDPFAIGNTVFDGVPSNAQLIVPQGTIKKYRLTDGWNSFAIIVEKTENEEADISDNGIYYNIKSDSSLEVIGLASGTSVADIPSSITIDGSKYRVTSIGAYAFEGRSDITYLSIPYSIKSIGEYAFRGCGSSMTVNIADPESWCKMQLGNEHASPLSSAGKMLVHDKETDRIDIPEEVTSIGAFTFYQCSCLKSLSIPGSVTSISSSAFEDCDYLTSLTLSNGLKSIGGSAFEGCKGLSTLTIPGTVNTIKVNAFKNCSALTSIISEIENPFEINNNVFNGIPSYAQLIVPKGKKSAYQSTAGWNQFTNIVEVGGVGYKFEADGIYYKIGQNNTVSVISGRKEYSGDVVIPSQVTYSGTTYNVTSIGDNAFYYCYRLTSVTFPNSMTSIGMMAFAGCEALTSITIPNSVTSIGFEAFACSSLTSITSEIEDPFSIGLSTFDEIGPNPQLIVPKGKKSIYQATAGWNQFTNIVEVGGVGYKFEADGIYYKIGENNTVSVTYGDTKYSGDVVIPSQVVYEGKTYSVTSIGVMAFYECSELTSITIPNSVKSIDDEAFSYSGITSVIIPESVWGIGWRAFCGCGLTSITFLGSVWIDKEAFMNCGALNAVHISDLESFLKNEYEESYEESNPLEYAHHLYLNGVEIKDLVIPNTITDIRHHAFYECRSLTSVTIPNSVTSIDECAFGGCSGLTSVVIGNGVKHILYSYAFLNCENLKEMILSQAAYENGIPESVTKFTTYSKDPMRVVVTSKGATSATMKIYPIDDSGNTNVDKCYTVTMLGLTPEQYIKWKLDDENYGIISEKTSALTLTTQPAQPTSTTKARLTAMVNEADDDQHYGFEWLRNEAPSNMPPNKVSAPLYEGKIMGSLSGLNPDIYYKYRPFYQSDSGETYYGEWIAFLTGDANVFFEPETHTKEATDVTDVSAQLAGVWIEGTEDTEEKGFEYWTVSKVSTRAVGSDAKTVAVSGNQTTITIDNLEAGKEYGYRTYMKTASGTTYGEEKTFKTILMGDVNDDGDVNEADVDDVASHIMGHSPTGFNKEKADMNHDGEVNAVDLVEIVKIVNSKK